MSNLRVKDIALQFTRRNYEAIQSKSQVLVSMLQQSKIHPRLAYEWDIRIFNFIHTSIITIPFILQAPILEIHLRGQC